MKSSPGADTIRKRLWEGIVLKRRILLAVALLVCGVFLLMNSNGERRVVNRFVKHRPALEQQMSLWEQNGTLSNTENWKAVNHWSGEHEMVEYLVTTAGDTYYGFYYSPDDVPLAFQNTDAPLAPAETEKGWIWTAEGDNRGRTYRLAEQWFYFEAKF